MSWFVLSLLSALFLGFYDIAKKAAVRENAVPPVLLCNVLTAALLWGPMAAGAWLFPTEVADWQRALVELDLQGHLLLAAKSLLVGMSWTLALFAIKRLPISIATPIRATSPLWTVTFAVVAMHERPTANQWCGMLLILIAFIAFSRVGKREGIHFRSDRGVLLMVLATLLGAASALYDKYLLQQVGLPPAVVQAWFSFYLVPVMLPLSVHWWLRERRQHPFQWRWSIPMIAVFLLIADFSYFTAVADTEALISVISPLRRTSILVPFLFGILHLGEKNWKGKLACICGILLGVVWLSQ
ncbi:EamA family transporter [Aureliella helgolandensis]|uniref:EamA-like transporter family protein n=1 Tax=Aureliella helgolandensis TaxID=2527968 RepID=A0A518G0G2_9BACT|nr:DMT family transporter [Aureliella helgolandensis]QDV22097.1 EamA-like transporter family protein [Aureliella helgolandensis]